MDNKVNIKVTATGAEQSKKKIQGVSGSLKGLAKQALAASAAYFGTRALLNGIQQSIDLFAKQELAEKKLEAALGKTSNMLLNQAKALQQVTMFGDEQIIEAQALIGSFVEEESAIAAATKATLDLAAAKGMELTVAADLVSKTLGSSTNALSRYGIEVVGAVGSTERLESLTGNLADVFGGQATQQTDTLAGAMAQMNNAIGDAQEGIGEALEPFMKSFAVATKNAAEAIGDFFQEVNESELETYVRQMKELGIDTKEYELTMKKLEKTQTLKKLQEDVQFQGDAQKELNKELEKYKVVLQDSADIILERVEQGKIEDRLERTREGIRLTNLEFKNAKEREALEERIDFLTQQVKLQTEINKLEKEEEVIQKKVNEAKDERGAIEKAYGKIRASETAVGAKNELDAALSGSKAHLIKQIMKHIGFPLNLLMAAGAGESIDKLFAKNKITAAQYGADFITDGPQMMLVGEGSGPERVQVTPLADPNLDGPQGGGVNVTFNNPIMTQDFVENQLMDNIKESLRLGGDIGIN
jgi:PAS domain-containing protein